MKRLLSSVIIIATALSLTSCGTIAGALTKGKRPAFILNAPSDIVIKKDGEVLDISLELFASKEFIGAKNVGDVESINYYTAAVKLPYKKATVLEFSSASLGKKATLEMKPKRWSGIFWGNLLFAPIVGHIVDGTTNNNKVLEPRYIDVASVLNNIPLENWESQSKLKRLEKRKIKKK